MLKEQFQQTKKENCMVSMNEALRSLVGKCVRISADGTWQPAGTLLEVGDDFLKIDVREYNEWDWIRFYSLDKITYIAEYCPENCSPEKSQQGWFGK
jgi:hypothetical protein